MYKRITIIALSTFMLWACKKDKTTNANSVVGKWKLTEQLIDPGDGSGTFTSVNSNKKITFNANGTFSSNATLCSVSTSTTGSSDGVYSETDLTITPDNCPGLPFPITYKLENGILTVAYPCYEACAEKFKKI